MKKWYNYDEVKPPMGEFVLAYHHRWIDEDYNPFGIRIGFEDGEGFVSAHYWDYQDCFMTISDEECHDNPEYSKTIRETTFPEQWIDFRDIVTGINKD